MVILISTLLFTFSWVAYMVWVTKNYGILPSVSASYLELPDKIKFRFTLFTWVIAISYIFISPTALSVMGSMMIVLVGGHPKITDKLIFAIHLPCAILGVTFSQLSIVVDHKEALQNLTGFQFTHVVMLVLFILVVGIGLPLVKNKILYIEYIAMGSISVLGILLSLSELICVI